MSRTRYATSVGVRAAHCHPHRSSTGDPHEDPRTSGATHFVSGDDFRAAMAQVATPVSVVTTLHAGTAYGTTVSAFLSLSMHPPMVLVSLDTASNLLTALEAGGPLGLNVLASGQGALARHFATKNEDKFAGIEWQLRAGAPRLPDLHVWIAGRVARITPAGDHLLVLVNVEEVAAGQGSPLTYRRGDFGTHSTSDASTLAIRPECLSGGGETTGQPNALAQPSSLV